MESRVSVSSVEDIIIHTDKIGNEVLVVETVKKLSLDNVSAANKLSVPEDSHFLRRASASLSQLRKESAIVVISLWQSYRGIVFAAFSALLFSVDGTLVKGLSAMDPAFIALFQFIEIGLFSLAALSNIRENAMGKSDVRFWLVLRGLLGATTWYLRYKTIHILPLANATIITLSMPVFVCIYARIFLKELLSVFHFLALGATVMGIGFTAKLDVILGHPVDTYHQKHFDRNTQLIGLGFGMATAMVGALSIVVLRRMKEVNHTVVLFNLAWVASIEMAFINYFNDSFKLPSCGHEPWLLMLVGIFSFFGQLMLTKALSAEEAGIVSVTRCSLDIILAFIFQITIFQKETDLYTIIGAILVASAVLMVNIRKLIEVVHPDHILRRWFGFLLN